MIVRPKLLLALSSAAVALYAIVAYATLPAGSVVHPELRASFAAQPRAVLYVHVFAAAVALLAGPSQFAARARPSLHRLIGRLYVLAGVGAGGVTGLWLALGAYGGPWSRAGFAALALAWMGSAAVAVWHARRGRVDAHRRWMVRTAALTLAAVSLRLGLPALVMVGVPMALAYPCIAWGCWVPQLALTEAWLRRAPSAWA